ncbi:hypothetical protein [Pseudomonas viridiflava]|uniref:hypothetical protein n=2 Tax=Pseudomonas TaxID=286 RepID=UPI0013CF3942|nr:hypothetical protein [Pseudomonas viridiflava]MEE4142595.1 hypothetical protein [Pseudomonas viridiflava]MEE4222598.1 hypothetical protein [Pseudomonas viridiflava]
MKKIDAYFQRFLKVFKAMNNRKYLSTSKNLRIVAAFSLIMTIILLAASLYIIWVSVLPIYGRLWRQAPIVEVQYIVFGVIPAPFIALVGIVTAAVALWTNKIFDPRQGSRAEIFQKTMVAMFFKTAFYVAIPLLALTTVWLMATGYVLCNELRPSGSGWQTFWVNNQNYCFKPDTYIEDHWPCKVKDGKQYCYQADGR